MGLGLRLGLRFGSGVKVGDRGRVEARVRARFDTGWAALGSLPISSSRCRRPGVLPRSLCAMSAMQPELSGQVTARQLMPSCSVAS